ncbi:MAG: L-threonylcarbamoyladenylate synthase [Candidatus Thorarchaeota archaeon]
MQKSGPGIPVPAITVTYTGASDLEEVVRRAVEVLRDGGIIVYPTDTSYGIGCDPRNPDAIDRLIAVKRRDPDLGLPLLFSDLNQCKEYHDFDELELVLARLFWPGPLTMIVRARQGLPPRVSGKHKSIAVRVPDHPVPREIARAIRGPIVGTSANLSGGPSPFDVETAREQLGDDVDLYIDGGRSKSTKNSTIVGVELGRPANIKVYREGELSIERLTESLRVDADALRYWTARIVYADM